MRMTTKLRQQLKAGLVAAPGCYDAFTARLAELAGFGAIHLTGFGVETTQLAAPDLGLISLGELASHTARITAALDIPVIADIDTGFGGVLNVQRTIREIERAGAAGVHLEDQALPKHCPLLAGRAVVTRSEALDRLKAALDARTDPDFVIAARCDADTISFNELVERCNLYLEAGADLAMPILMNVDGRGFFSLPDHQQMELLQRLGRQIEGPLMGQGSGPPVGYDELDMEKAGFRLLPYAATALSTAANAVAALFRDMKEKRTDAPFVAANRGLYSDPLNLLKVAHLDAYVEFERQHTTL
jgi:2-methylisocitrate lyase-like PEP mutase family enzyme